MDNNQQHINELLKQKFEDFTPQPSARVWEGIAAALDKEVAPVWYKTLWGKSVVAAVLIVALLFSGYWIINKTDNPEKNQVTVSTPATNGNVPNKTKDNTTVAGTSGKELSSSTINNKTEQSGQTKTDSKPDKQELSPQTRKKEAVYVNTTSPQNKMSDKLTGNQNQPAVAATYLSGNNSSVSERSNNIDVLNSKSIGFSNLPVPVIESIIKEPLGENNQQGQTNKNKQPKTGKWAIGFYFAPEFIAASYDSLTIQNGYALMVEPSYYFNSRWFVRPGIGLQYSRDKGFVQADFISWDKLGTYDDVVNVTFDTVNGNVTPVYHTQKVEVFDSVRHFTLSEETNRYLYLNTSLVFGYHNHKRKLGWSIYAGGGVNFILYDEQDLPVDDDVTYISLDYNLTKRHSPQYHIKVGFGLDYTIGKKWLVSVEPEYRYFVNGINGGVNYDDPLSGVGLRFGFVYMLK